MYLERLNPSLHSVIRAADRADVDRAFNRPGFADAFMFKALHRERWSRIERIQQMRRARARFLADLRDLAEDGMIAVVESGRDCDCVDYFGRVHVIAATLEAYNDLYDRTAEWADGPFYFALAKPSEADKIEYESRDRVLEAFEDGHRHHVYSSFAS